MFLFPKNLYRCYVSTIEELGFQVGRAGISVMRRTVIASGFLPDEFILNKNIER
jgi:hypothetical protein